MVQVFGNRILGGVGAPGGGMAESFGAGVGMALDQRGARQTMGIRDQEMAWKAEDRAEAKRRRQAAEAAAGRARAGRAAMFDAAMAPTGGFFPTREQLGAPRAGAASAPRGGPAYPLSMGTSVGAPSAPAAAPVAARSGAGLSMGAPVSGGAGGAMVRGGDGTDQLVGGLSITPGDVLGPSAAPPSARPGPRPPPQAGDRRGFFGQMLLGAPMTSADLPMLQRERQSVLDQIKTVAGSGVGGAELPSLQRELAEIDQQIESVAMTPALSTVRGPLDLEGPEAAGSFLTTAPGGVAPAAPGAAVQQAGLSFGSGVPAAPITAGGQMTFGPQLGAAPTPTEMFLSDLNLQPPGQLSLADLMQDYNGPLADPRASAGLEQQRAMWGAVAQDAAARKDLGAYTAAIAKMREQEDLILSAQLMQGVREVTLFNSPQRLSAVASMVNGLDMFIAPKEGGLADIYVGGELAAADRPISTIVDDLRAQVDAGYRAAQAEIAGQRAEAQLEVETEAQKALLKAQVDPAAVVLETDTNTGDIVVFDKVQRRMIGVITRVNPSNPEQPLPAPTFFRTN